MTVLCGMLITATSCSNDDKGAAPTDIDSQSITYEAKPGAVKLHWDIPSNANYKYIKVTYTLPENGKKCLRLASVHADTVLIDNLLKRYGEIEFKLQPFTKEGVGGKIHTIKAEAAAANKVIKIVSVEKIKITPAEVWTDSEQKGDGSLAELVDGKNNTYFHMKWGGATPFPHYIVMDMKELTSAVRFSYLCRDHGNRDNPKTINVLGSDNFDGENFDPAAFNAESVELLDNLPDTKAASYESSTIVFPKPTRYIWFEVKASTSGKNWVALAEMTVSKVIREIYNPETGETTQF